MPGCSRVSLGPSGTQTRRRDAAARGSPLFCRGGSPLGCRVDRGPFDARTSQGESRERHRTTAALCEPTNARHLAPSGLRGLMPASVLKAPRLGMHSVWMPPYRTTVMDVLRLFSLRLSVSCQSSEFDARHHSDRRGLHCRLSTVSRGRTTCVHENRPCDTHVPRYHRSVVRGPMIKRSTDGRSGRTGNRTADVRAVRTSRARLRFTPPMLPPKTKTERPGLST